MIEKIKLEKELAKIDSQEYAIEQLEKADNDKLDAIIAQIEEIYANDKRKISQVYGYGIIVGKILTIAKSIQYAKQIEKADLLMITGFSEQLVEDLTDAMGNTAYFNVRTLSVMEAIPMNIERVKELVLRAGDDLGLVSGINLNKLNAANVQYQYDRAKLKAEEQLENTLKYADTGVLQYTE
jgi:hypothetical protein